MSKQTLKGTNYMKRKVKIDYITTKIKNISWKSGHQIKSIKIKNKTYINFR